MTDEELKAIEFAARCCDETHQECCGASRHLPALIAEVRRLRAGIAEAANVLGEIDEKHYPTDESVDLDVRLLELLR